MKNKLEHQIEETLNLLETVPYNDCLYGIMKNDVFNMIHDYEGGSEFDKYMNRYLQLKKMIKSGGNWKEECRGI